MTSVERTFTVDASPAESLDYLKDFSNATEWDPGTQSCTQTTPGAIGVGTQWHNTSKILGVTTELTYTLKQLDDETVVLEGTNDSATATDTITVRPSGTGSEITYHADLEMSGLAKLGTPVMKLEFEKLAGQVVDGLTEALRRR